MQWLYEAFLKFVLTTGLAGITWIIVDGKMEKTVPFLIIEIIWLVIVFGFFLWVEHSDDNWDFW